MKKLEEEKGLAEPANTAPNSVRARSTKLRSVKAVVEQSRDGDRKTGPVALSQLRSVSALKLPAIKNKTHRRYESTTGLPGVGQNEGTEYGAQSVTVDENKAAREETLKKVKKLNGKKSQIVINKGLKALVEKQR